MAIYDSNNRKIFGIYQNDELDERDASLMSHDGPYEIDWGDDDEAELWRRFGAHLEGDFGNEVDTDAYSFAEDGHEALTDPDVPPAAGALIDIFPLMAGGQKSIFLILSISFSNSKYSCH